jgi:hypothetical protein
MDLGRLAENLLFDGSVLYLNKEFNENLSPFPRPGSFEGVPLFVNRQKQIGC